MTRIHSQRVLAAGLLALMSTLLGPARAVAQQGWTGTVQTLPLAGTTGDGPQLTFDPLGNAVAAWTRTDMTTAAIEVVRYRVGFGWAIPPVVISPPGQDAFNPRIASDGAGNVIAVWIRYDGANAFYVQSARMTAATGAWSAGADIAVVGEGGAGPALAVTAAGDALAIWTQQIGNTVQVQVIRCAASTGTWGPVRTVSAPGSLAYFADVAMAPNGTALAVWTRADGSDEFIEGVTYDGVAGTWGTPSRLSPSAPFAEDASVAVDAAGRGMAVWRLQGAVHSARYDPVSSEWSKISVLSTGTAEGVPALALDAQGDAVAVWRLSNTGELEAARYLAASHLWLTTTIPNAYNAFDPRVAIDEAGNAIAVWRRSSATNTSPAARFVHATDAWTTAVPLTATGYAYEQVVAAEPRGNFTALWLGDAGMNTVMKTARWSAAPAAPRITAIDVMANSVTIQVSPAVTTEAAFAATSYEYTLRALADWVPAPLASSITISGVLVGRGIVTVRAVNAAGPGEYTSQSFDVLPNPPSGFVTTSVAGNIVSFSWIAPPRIPPECQYELEGGVLPGQTLARLATGSSATTLTATAPTGVFYLRMRTTCYGVRSDPSNELRVPINVPEPPSAPADLLGLVDGSTLALSWTNTLSGGPPTALWIQVSGDVSGTAPIAMGETFGLSGIPAGTYSLRLVAVNASGASLPSNAVTLTFPGVCSGPPAPPIGFAASAIGATVTAAWRPPSAGPALTHYVLSATGSYVGAVATPLRFVSGALPPGTYTFHVTAANSCGTSAPAAAQTVIVP